MKWLKTHLWEFVELFWAKLKKEKIEPIQSFTEPPPRYTEASLVKALEEKGIGRPSTYSPTITTILERRYIEKEKKQLVPTDLGKVVNKLLVENFADVINCEFTAQIEEEFDKIAEGKENWKKIIREFYCEESGLLRGNNCVFSSRGYYTVGQQIERCDKCQ